MVKFMIESFARITAMRCDYSDESKNEEASYELHIANFTSRKLHIS